MKDRSNLNSKMQQLIANKRLDFEIIKSQKLWRIDGWNQFHPKSPYYAVCADVVVRDVLISNNIDTTFYFFFRGRADRSNFASWFL